MGLRPVVYIYPDIAFAVSFLMNGLILWGTGRINKLSAGWLRITAGAVVGAVYSFAAAFPQLGLLHGFWLKILFSVFMFAVSFAPLNPKRFITSLAVFYIVSFSLGGFFIGILYFFRTGPFYTYIGDLSRLVAQYFWPGLFITIAAYVLFTRFAGRLIHKKLAQSLFRVPLKVLFDELHIEVEALIDTGNNLQDPLSHTPVVVVEYNVLKNIFPVEIQTAFEGGPDPDLMRILDSLAETSWSKRFRVIPFTSLGKENGLLIGFRPDRIEVLNGASSVCTKNVVVGIYQNELSPEGSYRALLHPDILDSMSA
ncbi:MAG: sigma-E processing peptidase SpoIIGA [Eubacteriales bacterium]